MREELSARTRRCAPRCRRTLSRRLTAAAIAGAHRIDGYRVASHDVEDLLDDEPGVGTPVRGGAAARATNQLAGYAQAVRTDCDFTYSKSQLNALHWMLQGGYRAPEAGRWRREAAHVTDPYDPHIAVYRPPEPDRLATLMAELVSWLNEGDLDRPAVIRGAMAHLHLVMVHPWAGGNGRMSRFLQTLVTTRAGRLDPEFHSVEEWLGRHGNAWEYEKVLAAVGGPAYAPERDAHPWIRFSLLACHQQAQTVRHRLALAEECWLRLTDLAVARGLAECLTGALHEVALAGRLRSSRYQEAEDLSARQAQRDLQELVDAGLLTAVGRTRGRYFVPGDDYPPAVLETVRSSILTLTDPYQD